MKRKLAEVRRVAADLTDDPEELDPGSIADGELLQDGYVASADFGSRTIHQLLLRRCLVEGGSFAEAQIRSVKLRDVRFVRCDFSNAVLAGLEATRVEFIDCRLTGARLAECRMSDILLRRCEGPYAVFQDGAMTASEAIDSHLQEADFRNSNLEWTQWPGSDLTKADCTGCNLQNADFRGAILEGMIVSASDVRGAIVTPSQALEFSKLLGLAIR